MLISAGYNAKFGYNLQNDYPKYGEYGEKINLEKCIFVFIDKSEPLLVELGDTCIILYNLIDCEWCLHSHGGWISIGGKDLYPKNIINRKFIRSIINDNQLSLIDRCLFYIQDSREKFEKTDLCALNKDIRSMLKRISKL